jgi:hypothetical protein
VKPWLRRLKLRGGERRKATNRLSLSPRRFFLMIRLLRLLIFLRPLYTYPMAATRIPLPPVEPLLNTLPESRVTISSG